MGLFAFETYLKKKLIFSVLQIGVYGPGGLYLAHHDYISKEESVRNMTKSKFFDKLTYFF